MCTLFSVLSKLRWLFVVLFVAAVQGQTESNAELRRPDQETFVSSSELLSPWRSSGCLPGTGRAEFNASNCHRVTTSEWDTADTLSLFNADGTLWHRFSLTYKDRSYFFKYPKDGFAPFSIPNAHLGAPSVVVLRLVGESPNWHQVEVNEKTRATKFVPKNDRSWLKTSWAYWLAKSPTMYLRSSPLSLHIAPNGAVVDLPSGAVFEEVQLIRIEGDWAMVVASAPRTTTVYRGWLKWRDGRDLLVGTLLNGGKHFK
jgi:hypothetical protein